LPGSRMDHNFSRSPGHGSLPKVDLPIVGTLRRPVAAAPNAMRITPLPVSSQVLLTGFDRNSAQLEKVLRQLSRQRRVPS
jgi:hypothetical protein